LLCYKQATPTGFEQRTTACVQKVRADPGVLTLRLGLHKFKAYQIGAMARGIAAALDLAKGKLANRWITILRGRTANLRYGTRAFIRMD